MDSLSYLDNAGIDNAEALYEQFKANPASVDSEWQRFFEGFDFARTDYSPADGDTMMMSEFKVINLVFAYRQRGHLFTKTNPVRIRRKYTPTLDIENFGLQQSDMQTVFKAGSQIGIGDATLQEILNHLQQTYCHSVGVEYMYIRNPEIVEWLQQKMESCRNTPSFNKSEKLKILGKLTQSVVFEKFIYNKFPGQKSFSLSGCETLVPALDALINNGAKRDVHEVIIGMAHRGRLNILANILHQSYESIFSEFRGLAFDDSFLLGDVKYHLGYSSETKTSVGQKVKVGMVPNPSHLEAVNPVAEGIARAKIDKDYGGNAAQLLSVLIHGDASVSGQGIIYEVAQMSQLDGYKTGGTVHIVTNNQLGFTTNYLDGRSSTYCTDVAKVIQVPVFHVNADDVEAVVYVMQLALEFRQTFHRDIFIDLLGYRRFGHNESDEPRYTQPLLYKLIEKHPDPAKIYIDKLLAEKMIDTLAEKTIEACLNALMEENFSQSIQTTKEHIQPFLEEKWEHLKRANNEDFEKDVNTAVDENTLMQLGKTITEVNEGLPLFKKIIKILNDRRNMLTNKRQVDWAMAEHLAWATLLHEGFSVRVSGQDVERGTFSQRHAVITLMDSEEEYVPLMNVCKDGANFNIYNSLLSEYAVLGFELGYAMASPDILTIWEAQYGDFANGAQIIIDQYISSAEEKWNVMNGLTLLLPHGYEGQGAEHSSARIERFLSLCAKTNMQVVNCSTPANYFHVLRRQLKRDFRKPLVVFTPKSLLRHPACISNVEEFTNGYFGELLDDANAKPGQVKRLIFCSGKIYYDLKQELDLKANPAIAIIRLEQLFPLPVNQINKVVSKYNKASEYIWVQEEPENMGPWSFIERKIKTIPLKVIARPESGSTATGSAEMHIKMQKELVEAALKMG